MVVLVYPFLSLVSFFVAVVAAVWAVELYRLLRAGEEGRAWRVLITASVVFAVHQLYTVGRGLGVFEFGGVAQMMEVVFVTLLAYAFYTQRRAFFYPPSHRTRRTHHRTPSMHERSVVLSDDTFEDDEAAPDEEALYAAIVRETERVP